MRFGGKTFTYKLTDTTLTLTINGKQYPFRRASVIKPDVNDWLKKGYETGNMSTSTFNIQNYNDL